MCEVERTKVSKNQPDLPDLPRKPGRRRKTFKAVCVAGEERLKHQKKNYLKRLLFDLRYFIFEASKLSRGGQLNVKHSFPFFTPIHRFI
jgi:hypothetical protein